MKPTGKDIDINEYVIIIVDLKEIVYWNEVFILAKDVTQVFYVLDMSSKPKKDKSRNKTTKDKSEGDEPKPHIVLAGKRKIVGVDDVTDEEEYKRLKIWLRSQWRLTQVFF